MNLKLVSDQIPQAGEFGPPNGDLACLYRPSSVACAGRWTGHGTWSATVVHHGSASPTDTLGRPTAWYTGAVWTCRDHGMCVLACFTRLFVCL